MKRVCILLTIVLCVGSALSQTISSVQDDQTAMDYLQAGSVYFLKGDFKKAISPYQKALELEKAQRTLEKKLWYVLVDNLGMSYGITGDLKKAKEVFEYGISKDPEYPLFYYNMACTYAEMENMDKPIEYLKLAFERKENRIRGEEMPNPATDSSFERFMKNDKFLAALQELKRK